MTSRILVLSVYYPYGLLDMIVPSTIGASVPFQDKYCSSGDSVCCKVPTVATAVGPHI